MENLLTVSTEVTVIGILIALINAVGYVSVYRTQKARIEHLESQLETSLKFQEINDDVKIAQLEYTAKELALDYTKASDELIQESYYENMRLVLQFLWRNVPSDDWENFLDVHLPTNKDTYLNYLTQKSELLGSLYGNKYSEESQT